MSELGFTLLRISYLVLLWLLVGGALAILRRDIYGTMVTRRTRAAKSKRRPKKNAKSKAVSTLLVTEGPLTSSFLQLSNRPAIVGRTLTSTLVLGDDCASAQHARIYLQDNQWYVEDLGFTNGTVVGGVRITAPTPLNAKTPVRFGQTIMELR